MGYTEQCVVDWINEDEDRLNGFVALLGDQPGDNTAIDALRDKFSQLVPACGKFWQQLLLAAIAEADWERIATELTDRREAGTGGDAWVMVDRRKS